MKRDKRKAAMPAKLTRYVTFRTDAKTLERIDALAPRFTQPWRTPSRSDLVRIAVLAGLDALERTPAPDRGDPAGSGSSPAE